MFKSIFKIYEPFYFQKELLNAIQNGENVILQAPTGSGKTIASIIPFLHMVKNNKNFPKKLIYSTPLRILTNSLYSEIYNHLKESFPNLKVTIQTGEYSEDKKFEGDIIFTTIDQLLSSALSFPLSLSKSLANINAGAVFSSYLIFDEFHLLDEERALPTTINLLEKIKDITPFCIMTATLSNEYIQNISQQLNAKIIKIDKNDIKKIHSLQAIKNIFTKDEEIKVEDVLKNHKDKTIVVCNRVDRAISIYKELIKVRKNKKSILIHSRFFQEDKKAKEEEIIKYFGKSSKEKDIILISTQVIEVGVDISCDSLHSEIAPINSLLQRVGRCARWGGVGDIFIYMSENFHPYSKELSLKTFNELKKIDKLNYENSQNLIDEILTNYEMDIFENSKEFNFDRVRESWRDNDKSNSRNLIRDINNINVVLVNKDRKYNFLENLEAISFNPYSLKKKLIDNHKSAYILEENNIFFGESEFEKKLVKIDVEELNTYNYIALDSSKVGYSREFGLDFEGGNLKFNSKENKKEELPKYANKKDTYKEHIEAMIKIYKRDFKENLSYTIEKLKSKIDYEFNFDELMKFIIIMHDYGKLDTKWQNWAIKTQKEKNNYIEGEILAHTDREEGERNRPPTSHAGVGAKISLIILPRVLKFKKNKFFNRFNSVVAEAIIKHHSSQTTEFNNYTTETSKVNEVINILEKHDLSKFSELLKNSDYYLLKKEDLSTKLFYYDNEFLSILCFLFIRILRISDQKSFNEVENVFK